MSSLRNVVAAATAAVAAVSGFFWFMSSNKNENGEHTNGRKRLRVVLLGGGHTNTQLIKFFRAKEYSHVEFILISDREEAFYSGMLPGTVGGLYGHETEAILHLPSLCRNRGWRFICERASGIDANSQHVLLSNGESVFYDILSVDVGSETSGCDRKDIQQHAVTTRPIALLMPKLRSFEDKFEEEGKENQDSTITPRVVVVGAGAAGVELAFGVHNRLIHRFGSVDVVLLDSNPQVLSQEDTDLQILATQRLRECDISIMNNTRVSLVEDQYILLENGQRIPYDVVLFATGASAPKWIKTKTNLTTCEKGFISVNEFLQSVSHPNVFAAGDCASLSHVQHNFPPKAGVYAVRMGPPLIQNVKTLINASTKDMKEEEEREKREKEKNSNKPPPPPSSSTIRRRSLSLAEKKSLQEYHPQTGFLKLLMTGDGRAIGSKFGISFEGEWVWKMKNWIDQSWMDLYTPENLARQDDDPFFEPKQDDTVAPCPLEAASSLMSTDGDDFSVQLAVLRRMAKDDKYCKEVVAVCKKQYSRE